MIDPRTVPSFMLNDGTTIPCIGMGTFGSDRVTPDEVAEAVAGGIRAGWRLFDCAACYGNEDKIGKSSAPPLTRASSSARSSSSCPRSGTTCTGACGNPA